MIWDPITSAAIRTAMKKWTGHIRPLNINGNEFEGLPMGEPFI